MRCCDCHADGYSAGYSAGHAAAIDGSDWGTEDLAAIARAAKLVRDSNDNPDLSSGGSVAAFLEALHARLKKGPNDG